VLNANAASSAEIFGSLPAIETMKISPDGSRVAFSKIMKGEHTIYGLTLADRKSLGGIKLGPAKLIDMQWADNDHLLLVASPIATNAKGGRGFTERAGYLRIYDFKTGKIEEPIKSSGFTAAANIYHMPEVRQLNGETFVYFASRENTRRDSIPIGDGETVDAVLTELNLTHGTSRVVEKLRADYDDYLLDADGRILADHGYNGRDQHWSVRVRQNGKLVEVAEGTAAIDVPSIAGISAQGDAVWIESVGETGIEWRPLIIATGQQGAPVEQAKGFGSLILDRNNRVIGAVRATTDAQYEFFDEAFKKKWARVTAAFVGEKADVVSASDDYNHLIVEVDRRKRGPVYMYVNLNTGAALQLGDAYDGLPDLAEQKLVYYTAADGMQIPALLTLPNGKVAKNLPLVVLAHGGPAAHDSVGFDWWSQAFAAEGYAVLQANFRGSFLGWQHMSAGFGQWGRKMQTDLSDGVRFLVSEGTVDP
jgi:dipeptidyl aminopeptidase/acylaminoacyl peptidase